MLFSYFIGVDVSKNKLDFCLLTDGKVLLHSQTTNDQKGIGAFLKQCKQVTDFNLQEVIFCMEHTGIYNNPLLEFLSKSSISAWLESSLHIKHSSGLRRGKDDKIDAEYIALYAYRNRDRIKLWKPAREVIKQLKSLTALRTRLIIAKKNLKTALQEGGAFLDKSIQKDIQKCCSHSLKALEKDIEKTDQKLDEIIKSDAELNRLFNLITSVEGIGPVTAREILVTTNEFKTFTDPKKYACYAGVVPFPYRSGSSIRGRNKVSHLANKTVKTLLHMSALSAIRNCQELKTYYERKLEEGKHVMSIINAVRNKLILRVFAVVKNNQKYEKNYNYQLV